VQQYGVHETVNLAPSTPEFTAVDPFRNGLTPSNPLKPARPFWYTVDRYGLTIVGLRTETTGPLMVGGPPINVVENQVVGYVPWPDAIPIAQPDGEVPTDPTVTADHDKFAWRDAVGGVWEPVGIVVSYPTDEALASNSETPATYVYVVMKHSGYEWQSTPQAELPAGRDPNLRDKIVPQADLTKDSSLLVQVDVSQPDYPVDLFPTGPPIGGGLLGHNAGQPAFDPASDSVYVGNMPSTSLPTTPQVPNDLTSFVSVATLAPGELPAPGEVPAPVTVTVLCGPEHPEVAILAGVPQAWACIAEGGEGPFLWTFTNLPIWLAAHVDPITGQGDGILYGTPTVGTWTFQAHVDDNATTPPGTGDATITLIVTADPTTEYEYGELEWEVGTPAAVAIEGTQKTAGDPCALEATTSPGSLVPAWIDVAQIPGRTIDNTAVGGPVEHTIGCVVMGTPPISGERYEFRMPNLQFTWPSQNLPLVISGQVFGPYTFNPLPKGVGLSGLAWHQIDKIHDPSTEADMLNREFFGVEPYTGQMYRILPAYAGLEAEGTLVPPPALQGELDEVSTYATSAEVLAALKTGRPDIAAALTANPNLKVRFGDLVVEANPNPDAYVSATQIADPTGVDPTVIPIGGPAGSTIPVGAMLKITGTRDAEDPEVVTRSTISPINLPGMKADYLGLNSDLVPAIPGSEPGQTNNGALWVTANNTGYLGVVDTVLGKFAQGLQINSAASLGGASVNPDTGLVYVAGKSLQKVTVLGPGSPTPAAPEILSGGAATFIVGSPGWFMVAAVGSTLPALSHSGTLPSGVIFIDNGDGTANLAGIPDPGTQGSYPITITAANGVSPDAAQNFTLTVVGTPPAITSGSTASFTALSSGAFTVTATGLPTPTLSHVGALPVGVTFTDNGNGTATLAGTPDLGTHGTYPLTITAANGVPPNAIQNFTLTVNPAPPAAPQALTVAPLSGNNSGLGDTFVAHFFDVNGASDIRRAQVIFNASQSPVAACDVIYHPAANTLALYQEPTWSPALVVGTVATLQNNQCTLNVGNSSVVSNGADLTLNLALTFNTAWAGSKNIYLFADDLGGLNTGGWQLRGTYRVGQAPQALTVAPLSGSNNGLGGTFVAHFSDPNGASDIRRAQVIFNASQSPVGACDVIYYPGPNTLALYQETVWSTSVVVGTAATLQNNQCTLNVGSSSVVRNGNDLTLNLAVAFNAAWTGVKNIYMFADDLGGLNTGGWQLRGTYTVAPLAAPAAVSVAPLSGNSSGTGDTFVVHFSDANGASDIRRAQVIFNTSQSPLGACDVIYHAGPNTLALYQETVWSPPAVVGTATTLQNNQCTLNVGNSSVVRNGNDLTLNLALTFNAAWTGSKNVYLFADDLGGLSTGGWQLRGIYTVVP